MNQVPTKLPPPSSMAPKPSTMIKPPAKERPSLSTGLPPAQRPRIILNSVEGWGKTSAGAFAPQPVLLLARDETGYLTLLEQGLVPDVPRAVLPDWQETLAMLDGLIEGEIPGQTLVLDALGGFERMCHEHVCNRDFDGDWGEKGFSSFQRGYDVAVKDWLMLLQKLDQLRLKGMTILLLSHTRIAPFRNPLGPDYDKIQVDIHHKTWSVTARWCTAILFGNFVSDIKKVDGKRKGCGTTARVIYTERRDAFDAKNQYGMPESIDVPKDPSQIWSSFAQYFYCKTSPNGSR